MTEITAKNYFFKYDPVFPGLSIFCLETDFTSYLNLEGEPANYADNYDAAAYCLASLSDMNLETRELVDSIVIGLTNPVKEAK